MSEIDLGSSSFWWLMLVGSLSGAASLLVSRRLSDAGKLRAAGNAMTAHLIEFRLFAHEPVLILRAQRDLLAANVRLLKLLLPPLLVLAIPFALILAAADAFFGRAALQTGDSAVVTAHFRNGFIDVRLLAPEWISVETPPIYVKQDNEMSWRIRPNSASSGNLQVQWNSRILDKTVSAAQGLHWISEQRSGSVLSYLSHLQELPFSDGPIDWIRIQYPAATVFGFHWLVWFLLAACGGAILSTVGILLR